MTDEKLMRAYIEGDMAAFRTLYQRYKGRVLGFLSNRLQNRDEAEEVFQEVFTKLHAYLFRYRDEVPFVAWLFTIAKNASTDHLRKQQIRDKYLQLSPDQVDSASGQSKAGLTIGEAFSELTMLSPQRRNVLELRFNENFSFADIASMVEGSESSVRKMASRAIQKLRGLMPSKEMIRD